MGKMEKFLRHDYNSQAFYLYMRTHSHNWWWPCESFEGWTYCGYCNPACCQYYILFIGTSWLQELFVLILDNSISTVRHLKLLEKKVTKLSSLKRNETLNRVEISSRKQENAENLRQVWNSLNGLAAKCNFGAQTESLVYDIFILKMHNKASQDRFCTKPNACPDEALTFVVAFEEKIKRRASYDLQHKPLQVEVKSEAVVCVLAQVGAKTAFTVVHVTSCSNMFQIARPPMSLLRSVALRATL